MGDVTVTVLSQLEISVMSISCLGENETAGRQKFKEISVESAAPEHAFSALQQYTLIAHRNGANEWQTQHGGNHAHKQQPPVAAR
jgi:hypothetical protein